MSTPASPLGSRELDGQATVDLDTTTAALEGGIGTLNPETGARIVRTWQETLQQSDWEPAHPIAELLGELHDALTSDALDGAYIGDLLLRLAEATRAAAAEAPDARFSPSLDRLATLLETGGRALGASPLESESPRVSDDEG